MSGSRRRPRSGRCRCRRRQPRSGRRRRRRQPRSGCVSVVAIRGRRWGRVVLARSQPRHGRVAAAPGPVVAVRARSMTDVFAARAPATDVACCEKEILTERWYTDNGDHREWATAISGP